MTILHVKSEITGVVGQILVREGDAVNADDVLLNIESMKMEIPLVAPRAGRVNAVRVAEGEVVSEGDAPVWLEV